MSHTLQISDEIAKWLRSINTVISVNPCNVIIGKVTYPACRYSERLKTPENSQAWNRGERDYTREMIYCVGMLPAVKVRGNVAFYSPGWTNEWYVAGYFGSVAKRVQQCRAPTEHHPFGNMFLLAPWGDLDGLKIDHWARVPYKRVEFIVKED